MKGQPDIAAAVRAWVEKAEHDLRNAEYVLTLKENCPTDTVCFHCQQCAEKYLKALLVSRGVAFPRTHDIVLLLNLAKRECGLVLAVENVQPLNRYSVESRYPGDWELIDMQEAAEAVRMARNAREAVRALLPRGALNQEEQ
ncbi:MAG: HEPN domain-containing protein [Kiritimatiellaeota bacterium]|nr:HEPN domain-containing protein [Kiritimatiellota bacterium]